MHFKHLVSLFGAFIGLAATSQAQPNILFILTEDQGAHMGALGTTDVKTPHMDALARQRCLVSPCVCRVSGVLRVKGLHHDRPARAHKRSGQ